MWESATGDLSRPRPWSLLAYVISHQPLRPLSVSVVFALGEVSTLLQEGTKSAALIRLISSIAAIWIVMTAANALMRLAPRMHAFVFVSAALLLQVPPVVASVTGLDERAAAGSPTGVAATVIAGLIVILATSTFGAVRGLTQTRLDSIATQIDSAFVESTARSLALARVLREASAIVHGAVQARLLGCAIAVEDAALNKDPEQFSAALARALDALENPLVSLGRPAAASLSEELSRRRELWDGLCEVTYTIVPNVPDLPPESVLNCGRIVEEGISNAVRHGDAQRVSITIDIPADTSTPRQLRIMIHDNGDGIPSAPPRLGLGLRMIQSVADSWSLTTQDGVTTLSVRLSIG
jgi:signal transduction histidine kinase